MGYEFKGQGLVIGQTPASFSGISTKPQTQPTNTTSKPIDGINKNINSTQTKPNMTGKK